MVRLQTRMMAVLREVAVEIVFASRVVSVILRCRAAVGTVSGGATVEGATDSERR